MSDGSIRRQTGPLITPISTPKPAPKIEPPKAPEPPKEAPKTESQDTLHPPTTDATREAIAGPIDPRQLENLRGTFTTLDAAMDFAAKDKGSELIQSFEIEGQTVYTVQDLDTRQKAEELMSEEAGLAMVLDQNRGLDILDTGEEASAPPEIRMAELLELAEGAALNEHTALNSREGLKHGQLQKNLGELMQGLVDQHAVLHREMTAQPPDSPRAAILKNQMQEAELMYLALKTRMQILPDTRQRNPQTGLVIKGTGVPIPAMPTMSDWGKALDTQPSDNIVGCLRSQSDKVQTQIEGYIKAIKGSPEAETPHGQRALRVYQATQEVFGDLSAQAQQAKDRTDERKKALGAISDALHDAQQQLTGYKQELQALDTALQHGAPDLSAIETRVNEIGEHLNQVHGRLLNEMETELGIFRDHVSENKAGGKAAIALLEGQILKLRAVADAPPHKMLQALEEALPQWKEGAWLKELTQAGRSFDGITPGEVTQVGQVVTQTNGYLETRAQNQVKQTEVQGQVKVQKLARELESVATEAFHLKPPGNYSEATQQLQTLSTYAADMQDVLAQHLDGVKASPEWQSLELVKDLLQQQQQPPSAHNTPEAKAKLKADIQHTLGMISEPDVRKSIALLADIAFERCSGHDKLKQTESQNLPEIEVKRHTRVHPRYESETTTTSLNAPDLKDNPLQAAEVDAVQTEVNNATLDILIEHYDKASQRFEEFAKSDDLMLDVLVAEAKRLKEANPGKNNREGIIRMMNIYFGGGDHEGNSKYAHMADAIFKLAHGGDRKNPYIQNTVLPYLREGVAKRLETLQERATVLKAMKAGGLNEFDQTVAAAMNLSPENRQLLNRKRVDDLVLSTLQKNPTIRQQVFDRMQFKHSADQFPTAENLPQKPTIENFSGRKEVLFIYQAAHEGEPSVGDFLEGVVKDLPGIKTVVQAMEAYDKEVGASAHINSIDEAAKAKRAVVVGIVETIGTTGLDIMTAGATRALRLKGVVASVVENTVSAGADSLMNDSNFFENLGKGMVVGKVFELGGKALDLRINKNRDMSITTPDGKTLHGKVLDLDPHSGQITIKLEGADKPLKLDMKLHSPPQPKQHAVDNLEMEPMEFNASAPKTPDKPTTVPPTPSDSLTPPLPGPPHLNNDGNIGVPPDQWPTKYGPRKNWERVDLSLSPEVAVLYVNKNNPQQTLAFERTPEGQYVMATRPIGHGMHNPVSPPLPDLAFPRPGLRGSDGNVLTLHKAPNYPDKPTGLTVLAIQEPTSKKADETLQVRVDRMTGHLAKSEQQVLVYPEKSILVTNPSLKDTVSQLEGMTRQLQAQVDRSGKSLISGVAFRHPNPDGSSGGSQLDGILVLRPGQPPILLPERSTPKPRERELEQLLHHSDNQFVEQMLERGAFHSHGLISIPQGEKSYQLHISFCGDAHPDVHSRGEVIPDLIINIANARPAKIQAHLDDLAGIFGTEVPSLGVNSSDYKGGSSYRDGSSNTPHTVPTDQGGLAIHVTKP